MQYAISKQEINAKPALAYPGEVRVVREEEDVAAAVELLRGESLLGFDTETRPVFRKGQHYAPSLLQLASEHTVVLFQLRRVGDLAPVFSLLADPSILKAGVAVCRDVNELRLLSPFTPAGFHDVGHMAMKRGFKNAGLRSLAALLLDGRISKGAQTSNWAANVLSEKQILYAATDAWVSRNLYQAILAYPIVPKEKEPRDVE